MYRVVFQQYAYLPLKCKWPEIVVEQKALALLGDASL